MKRNTFLLMLLYFTLIMPSACIKSGPGHRNSLDTVYIGGFTDKPTTIEGAYWKNGAFFSVPNTLLIRSVCLSNHDVYLFAGVYHGITYWKNGVPITIPDAEDVEHMFVFGSDVYITGASGSILYSAATYFKNGNLVNLTSTFHNVINAFTSSIAISGDDVYVAGYLYYSTPDNSDSLTGVYWKNGVLDTLPNCEEAKGIAVVGNDVVVGGSPLHGGDAYWLNGVLHYFEGNLPIMNLACVAVSGSDVYFGGLDVDMTAPGNSRAAYWKNGKEVVLAGGEEVTGLAVIGSDVYACGYGQPAVPEIGDASSAVYWKNGVVDTLVGGGGAASIAVAR